MKGFRKGGTGGLELVAQSKTGALIPVEISLSPIKSRSGILVVASLRDITERKQAEKALRASEENFRRILESVGDGIFGVDKSGCLTFINPSATRMLGFDPDDLIGKEVHAAIHHTHADGGTYPVEDCPMFQSFTRGTREHISDEVLWRRDGSSFDVEYSSVPIVKEDRIAGAVISFRDITQRREMEAAPAGERERLQNILDTSPVGVGITTKGIFRFFNPRFEEMFDVRMGEAAPEIYADQEDRKMILDELAAGRQVENKEIRLIGKEKKIRDMLVNFMPIDFEGERGILGWVLDITERKRSEKALREKFDELDRFRRLAVGREHKMILLKEEINTLAERLGEQRRYRIAGKEDLPSRGQGGSDA